MTTSEKLHVQIGQVKIGREGQSLHAILGSCIGIGFLYPRKGVFGLAHCLLSNSGKATNEGGGRHVDQAIRTLLSMMDVSGRESRRIDVILAGGANMSLPADTDPKRLVGSINADFAYKAIRDMGMHICFEDLGGMNGRSVTIDCTTGEYSVSPIPRLGEG